MTSVINPQNLIHQLLGEQQTYLSANLKFIDLHLNIIGSIDCNLKSCVVIVIIFIRYLRAYSCAVPFYADKFYIIHYICTCL